MFGRNRGGISVAELVAIKEEWGISCMAIMARVRDLALITAGRFKSFCIMANKQRWRKGEPGNWKGDEMSGRFKQLVMRALSSDIMTASKA
jgi:Zn-dependent peptidase ImmA (M78 family)